LDGERRGVAPDFGVEYHACVGKERFSIESELHSFGEDVLFCNTLDARSFSRFSPVNCSV
jgi:hypothetical protein